MSDLPKIPPGRLLRWPELRDRIPISHSRVYAMMKNGTFPRTIKLGARSVAWFETEIDEWLQQRFDKRGR